MGSLRSSIFEDRRSVRRSARGAPPRLASCGASRSRCASAGSAPASWARSMAGHLLDAGHEVTVFNRTKSKRRRRCSSGARAGRDTPAAVAEGSDVVFTIVGFPADVREVDPRRGRRARRRWSRGSLLVDMTTSEPSLAVGDRRGGRRARRRRARRARLRRRRRRRKARCRSWSAASEAAVERAEPLFEAMGKTIVAPGAAGRRPAHEDGQPDPDRVQHDRGLRGAALRATGPGSTPSTVLKTSAAARPARGRWRTTARGCSPATSSRASRSTTSSRTWGSPSPRRAGWACAPRPRAGRPALRRAQRPGPGENGTQSLIALLSGCRASTSPRPRSAARRPADRRPPRRVGRARRR